MTKYAVEIGRVVLRSDKPITMEQRKRAIALFKKREGGPLLYVEDAEVVLNLSDG